MIEKLRNKKILIALCLIAILVLGASIAHSHNKTSIQNIEIKINTPRANIENLNVSVEPFFDYEYHLDGEVLTLEPLSLLTSKTKYTISVGYKDENGQDLLATKDYTYVDPSKIMSIVEGGSIPSKNFDLYARNRHSFYALVTTPGVTQEEVTKESYVLLEKYGVNPKTVDFEVQFSRYAREDGESDPFSPVPSN